MVGRRARWPSSGSSAHAPVACRLQECTGTLRRRTAACTNHGPSAFAGGAGWRGPARRVPTRTLYTGARIPAIGLGTFASDRYTGEQVAAAVTRRDRGGLSAHRLRRGLRQRAARSARCWREAAAAGLPRDELWITSKLWNDKHGEAEVIAGLRAVAAGSAAGLPGPLPGALAVPQLSCAGRGRQLARSPCHGHTSTSRTWPPGGRWSELVERGLVRHIGTSNMTIPKLAPGAARCRDQAGLQRDGTASALPAAGTLPLSWWSTGSCRSASVRSDRRAVRIGTRRRPTRWISRTR